MYEQYFHFRMKPFELVPNPDFLYLSTSHQKAMTYLTYGLEARTGFMMLTGEVGSGKTTLIRYFMRGLDKSIPLSKIFNTRVNAEQLLDMIIQDFGLENSSRDKVHLMKQLYDFLIEEYSKGRQALLIIDEAQNLTPELLEEVRMLSNLETDDTKLLQILLVGQPELNRVVAQPGLRQLRQRIGIVCHLNTLSRQETEDYIYHRLEIAGNRSALTFTGTALDAIHLFSNGVPRLINAVSNLLLLTAFSEGVAEVNREMVDDVVESLNPQQLQPQIPVEHQGRRVLLDALGISARAPQRDEGGGRQDQGMQALHKLLVDMNRRIRAMESSAGGDSASDLADLRARLRTLEELHQEQIRNADRMGHAERPQGSSSEERPAWKLSDVPPRAGQQPAPAETGEQ